MTITRRLAGNGLFLEVAAAGAILAAAPIASAEEPSEECPPQSAPSSEQQQCEQQQSAPGMPGMPEMPDNSNSGNPQQVPQQAPEQAPQQKPQQGDLADKNCWVVNGVPYWNAPRATGPGDVVSWCPTTYGLTPH